MDKMMEQLEGSWSMDIGKREYPGAPQDVFFIFNRARDLVHRDPASALELCEATLECVWELLNVGRWSCVPQAHQQIYADASFLKCLLLIRRAHPDRSRCDLKSALRACDMGLLLGTPVRGNLLHDMGGYLDSLLKYEDAPGSREAATTAPPVENEESLPPAEALPRLECPSLETFYKNHFCPMKPAIISNTIDHWPARTKWNAEYLKQVAGGRLVPVELGTDYVDNDWGQQLMTISEFVDDYMLQSPTSTKPKGYLAQHMLFEQVPELKEDIYEPEYCSLGLPQHDADPDDPDAFEGPRIIEVNAWFGPAGTVSPLHHDQKNNIFCQVQGYKRVWLFSTEDSAYLYPHDSPLLYNTARVDPEKPNLEMFPEYAKARAYRCVLGPGDCLFIPAHWWHHVRALTPSMSVSFWWEGG